MPDKTYSSKTYRRDGGDTLVVASGGKIAVETGGILTLADVALTATASQLNTLAGSIGGLAAVVAASLGGSHSSVNTEVATSTVVAAHATKDRACLVIVTIDETYAVGGGTAPTLKVGEDDTVEKAFAATTIASKTAGTVLVAAFTNLATKKILVTTTAKVGGGTGGATVTVIAVPTT